VVDWTKLQKTYLEPGHTHLLRRYCKGHLKNVICIKCRYCRIKKNIILLCLFVPLSVSSFVSSFVRLCFYTVVNIHFLTFSSPHSNFSWKALSIYGSHVSS